MCLAATRFAAAIEDLAKQSVKKKFTLEHFVVLPGSLQHGNGFSVELW